VQLGRRLLDQATTSAIAARALLLVGAAGRVLGIVNVPVTDHSRRSARGSVIGGARLNGVCAVARESLMRCSLALALRSFPALDGWWIVRRWSAAGSRLEPGGLTTAYGSARAGLLGTSGLLIVVPAWWPPRAARFARQLCRLIGRRAERGCRPQGGAACSSWTWRVFVLEYMTPCDLTNQPV
jgi:hypothetical protein